MPLMKAAVVHAFWQPLEIEELPVPDLRPGQVLVKVMASGGRLDEINAIFDRMRQGEIDSRIVMRIGVSA